MKMKKGKSKAHRVKFAPPAPKHPSCAFFEELGIELEHPEQDAYSIIAAMARIRTGAVGEYHQARLWL